MGGQTGCPTLCSRRGSTSKPGGNHKKQKTNVSLSHLPAIFRCLANALGGGYSRTTESQHLVLARRGRNHYSATISVRPHAAATITVTLAQSSSAIITVRPRAAQT